MYSPQVKILSFNQKEQVQALYSEYEEEFTVIGMRGIILKLNRIKLSIGWAF
jgi:hypothetical protein